MTGATGSYYEISESYTNMQALQDATITLDSDEIGATYFFSISGQLGSISYNAYIENYTIRSGENIVSFDLKANGLGQGNGNADITFDLSAAGNYSPVDHAEVFVHRSINYEDIIYSCTLTKESENSSIFRFTEHDIPADSYKVEVNFYATSSNLALLLTYPFVMQVAENLTSRAIISIDKLNPVYNIEYDMNADGDTNIDFDYQANSITTKLSKAKPGEPKREGFVFLGWQIQNSTGWEWYNPEYYQVNSDFTLRAVWESAYTGDDSYLVTKETARAVITAITEGTKENPAVIRLRGYLDLDFYDNVFQAINANPNVNFEFDFSGLLEINFGNIADSERLVYDCNNLVKIDLSQNFPLYDNMFRACRGLSSIVLTEQGWRKVIDNVLFEGDTLICYPAGLDEDVYTVPANVTNIRGFAFSSSSLNTIILPDTNHDFYVADRAFENCQLLQAIEVPDGNRNYTSINGVLYFSNGRTLVKYPEGKSQTSFVVPQNVEGIYPYAFVYAENLQSISFEDSNAVWYITDRPTDNIFELLNYQSAIDTSDSSLNASRFESTSSDYYDKCFQKVNYDSLLTDEHPLTVYDDVCYDVSDETYTVSYFDQEHYNNNYCLYKIPTEIGSSYIVVYNECMKNNYYGYSYPFANVYCQIISSSGKGLETMYMNDGRIFTAESDYTYCFITTYGEGYSYLRFSKAPVTKKDISLIIENDNRDIEIYIDNNTNQYMNFGINGFDYYYNLYADWYLDGNLMNNGTANFSLNKDQYSGIHLITAEILLQKDYNSPPQYYSASKQVVID